MNNKILSVILTVLNDITISVFIKDLEKQEYNNVFHQFRSDKSEDLNTDIASPLQKKVAEELLKQKNPNLDAVPLFRRLSFNKDNNTWRIDTFSLKVSQFGDEIKQKTREAFENAFTENGYSLTWAEMVNP